MKNIKMFMHLHREFPFNYDSEWVFPCYAGGTEPFEWKPPIDRKEFINVTPNGILNYRHYYANTSEDNFLKAIGQQATDCFAANLGFYGPDYIGVGSYRRYLFILDAHRNPHEKITMPANEESVKFLTSNAQLEAASKLFDSVDVIINRPRTLDISIEEQYLQSQPREYWDLFKEAIVKVNSTYAPHIWWFTQYNIITYEGVYIMRKDLFYKLVNEYFQIMEYIWKNCKNTYPTERTTSEPLPWRYPGFLNERFVPFFIFANSLKKAEVPLVFLN